MQYCLNLKILKSILLTLQMIEIIYILKGRKKLFYIHFDLFFIYIFHSPWNTFNFPKVYWLTSISNNIYHWSNQICSKSKSSFLPCPCPDSNSSILLLSALISLFCPSIIRYSDFTSSLIIFLASSIINFLVSLKSTDCMASSSESIIKTNFINYMNPIYPPIIRSLYSWSSSRTFVCADHCNRSTRRYPRPCRPTAS